MGILWFGPVAEHHRDGREHLHIDSVAVAFRQARPRIPAVLADITKRPTVNRQARAAWTVLFKLHESAVTVARLQIGQGLGQDVCMDIDL